MNLRYKYGLDIIEDFETGGFSYNKNDSKDITITIPYSDVFSGNNTSKIVLPGILVSDTSSITIIAKQENSDTFMQEIKMSDITDYEVSRPKDLKKDFSFEEEEKYLSEITIELSLKKLMPKIDFSKFVSVGRK